MNRRRSAVWLVGAQVASSCSNMLLTIAVARTVPAAEFGVFALVFPFYLIIQKYVRTAYMVPLQISAGRTGNLPHSSMPKSLILLLLCLSVCLAMVSLFLPFGRTWLSCMALVLPFLIIYDWERHFRVLLDRQSFVLLGDLVWLIAQIVLFILLFETHARGQVFLLGWAFPAALIGISWMFNSRGRCRGQTTSNEGAMGSRGGTVGPHWDGMSDVVALLVLTQGMMLVVSPYVGLATVGGIRGVQSLLGPVTLVFSSILPLVQIHFASPRVKSLPAMRTALLALAFAGLGTVGLATALNFNPKLGEYLLGQAWTHGEVALFFLAGVTAVNASLSILYADWRAHGRLARLAFFRIASAFLQSGTFVVVSISAGVVYGGWAWLFILSLIWLALLIRSGTKPVVSPWE